MELFCYGSLQSPEIQQFLLGRTLKGQEASLPFAQCKGVRHQVYPGVILDPKSPLTGKHMHGELDPLNSHKWSQLFKSYINLNPTISWVSGMLYSNLTSQDKRILDEYEGYHPHLDDKHPSQLYICSPLWVLVNTKSNQKKDVWKSCIAYLASAHLQDQLEDKWVWEEWNTKAQQAGGWIHFMNEFHEH